MWEGFFLELVGKSQDLEKKVKVGEVRLNVMMNRRQWKQWVIFWSDLLNLFLFISTYGWWSSVDNLVIRLSESMTCAVLLRTLNEQKLILFLVGVSSLALPLLSNPGKEKVGGKGSPKNNKKHSHPKKTRLAMQFLARPIRDALPPPERENKFGLATLKDGKKSSSWFPQNPRYMS